MEPGEFKLARTRKRRGRIRSPGNAVDQLDTSESENELPTKIPATQLFFLHNENSRSPTPTMEQTQTLNENPTTSNNNKTGTPINNSRISASMFKITHQKTNHAYEIKTSNNIDRLQLADAWYSIHPHNQDEILKTSKGFILKTNENPADTTQKLLELVSKKTIINFSTVNSDYQKKTYERTYKESYSVVIHQMEYEIPDDLIKGHLEGLYKEIKYCKRIIARATNKPTQLIRIITEDLQTFEQLLSQGLYFKCRRYPISPSKAPQPIPMACSKCDLFTHTTENCNTPSKCLKCNEPHPTKACKTDLVPKCAACGSTEHTAWSMKCPQRPKQPIEGIPNIKIRSVNKKTNQVSPNLKKKHSKLHSPVTLHDAIINNYSSKLNNAKNTNREELIKKLKQKYLDEHNVDTCIMFSGNRFYILMFDLDEPELGIATEPCSSQGVQQAVING